MAKGSGGTSKPGGGARKRKTPEKAGLPPLEGSEKQVEWAGNIRDAALAALNTPHPEKDHFGNPITLSSRVVGNRAAIEWARNEGVRMSNQASWWIDNFKNEKLGAPQRGNLAAKMARISAKQRGENVTRQEMNKYLPKEYQR